MGTYWTWDIWFWWYEKRRCNMKWDQMVDMSMMEYYGILMMNIKKNFSTEMQLIEWYRHKGSSRPALLNNQLHKFIKRLSYLKEWKSVVTTTGLSQNELPILRKMCKAETLESITIKAKAQILPNCMNGIFVKYSTNVKVVSNRITNNTITHTFNETKY